MGRRRLTENVGASVNELLSSLDFLLGGGKLFPALRNHVLGPLKLSEGVCSD